MWLSPTRGLKDLQEEERKASEVDQRGSRNDGGRRAEMEIRGDRQADMNSRCALETFSDSDSKYFKVTRSQSWPHTGCFVLVVHARTIISMVLWRVAEVREEMSTNGPRF